jgi:chloramphenicol 3-O-phosphotransferase
VHRDMTYDLTVDSGSDTVLACAEAICRALDL